MDLRTNVPVDWLGCPKIAKSLIANKFLAFKSPLHEVVNSKLPESEKFALQDVFDYIGTLKKASVLWIDLTGSSGNYIVADVDQKVNYHYKKIAICGNAGFPPKQSIRDTFNSEITSFLESKREEDCLVAVHCTHGFNRTGFMICSYLVEIDGWTPTSALREFMTNRSPGIYRRKLVKSVLSLANAFSFKVQEHQTENDDIEHLVGVADWLDKNANIFTD